MISFSASPELTTFPSSTAEEKKLAPADFKAVLEQVDERLKNKYKIARLQLSGSFTSEQLSQLAEKIKKVAAEWKAAINLADYKAALVPEDEQISDYALEEEFDEFKADGKLWDLDIESTDDEKLVAFVVAQLQTKKIEKLRLRQYLSEKSMERIIYACKNAALGVLCFEKNKSMVTDSQAQMLLDYVTSSNLEIDSLPGKDISPATAEQFAVAFTKGMRVSLHDCSHFDFRCKVERSIVNHNFNFLGLAADYFRVNDIERLAKKYINSSHPTIFTLMDGSYTDPAWVTFFTQILQSSSTKVISLRIADNSQISNEVLFAIIRSIGINKTIRDLTIYKSLSEELIIALANSLKLNTALENIILRQYNPSHVSRIVESLLTHPRLNFLDLDNSNCRGLGNVFNRLLTQTRTLKTLRLECTSSDDDTIGGLAKAIPHNTVLTELCLGSNAFTDIGLGLLSDAISKNQALTHLSFCNSYQKECYYTISGLNYFIDRLQLNNYIVSAEFSWRCITAELGQFLLINQKRDSVIQRNCQLARLRQSEKKAEECQPYVETAIILFQAHRQRHVNWHVLVMLEKILSFLVPPTTFARPDQVKRCTDLVRSNLFTKPFAWKTSMKEKTSNVFLDSYSFTVFKRWNEAISTSKESKSDVQSQRRL